MVKLFVIWRGKLLTSKGWNKLETRVWKNFVFNERRQINIQDLPNRQDSFHFTSAEHRAEQQRRKKHKVSESLNIWKHNVFMFLKVELLDSRSNREHFNNDCERTAKKKNNAKKQDSWDNEARFLRNTSYSRSLKLKARGNSTKTST